MSWKINLHSSTIEYQLGDDSFYTDDIKLLDEKFYTEPGGYKEPDETVCEATYEADSEHGKFTWKVTARCSGFDTDAVIEEVCETITPDQSIEADTPSFYIEDEDEADEPSFYIEDEGP